VRSREQYPPESMKERSSSREYSANIFSQVVTWQ